MVNDGNLKINLVIPLLVTTASLYVINRNSDIKTVRNANQIKEVATRVNSLLVYQEPSIDLSEYSEKLFEKLNQDPRLLSRLKELNSLWNEHSKREDSLPYNPLLFDLHSIFIRSSSKILVVEYDSLEIVIKRLLKIFKATLRSVDKFAVLKNDFDKHKSYFETKTWFEAYVQDSGSKADE